MKLPDIDQPDMPLYGQDQDAYVRQMQDWHNQMAQYHEQQRAYHLERVRYFQQMLDGAAVSQRKRRKKVLHGAR